MHYNYWLDLLNIADLLCLVLEARLEQANLLKKVRLNPTSVSFQTQTYL